MSTHAALPARYDHVGSFLRPKYLLEAREKRARSEISAAGLRAVEDQAIGDGFESDRLLKGDDFADGLIFNRAQLSGADFRFSPPLTCFKQIFRTQKTADVVVAGGESCVG